MHFIHSLCKAYTLKVRRVDIMSKNTPNWGSFTNLNTQSVELLLPFNVQKRKASARVSKFKRAKGVLTSMMKLFVFFGCFFSCSGILHKHLSVLIRHVCLHVPFFCSFSLASFCVIFTRHSYFQPDCGYIYSNFKQNKLRDDAWNFC